MLEEKLHQSVIYRNDRQRLRNPFPASKTHFIFQLKTRTFVRPNVRRNERTNAHTHTHVIVMPLSWCLACGGTWGLALRGKLYGLLAYFTLILFFFTKTNMKLVNGLLLTVLVAEVSSPTHTTHTHSPMLAHNIYPPQHLSKQEPFHTASQRIRTCRSVSRKKHERSKQRQYSSV